MPKGEWADGLSQRGFLASKNERGYSTLFYLVPTHSGGGPLPFVGGGGTTGILMLRFSPPPLAFFAPLPENWGGGQGPAPTA